MSDFITRQEFEALRNDVTEIRRDVKKLLGESAGDVAVERFRTARRSSTLSVSAILVAGLSAVLNAFHPFH